MWPRFAYLRLVVAEQTRRGRHGGGGGGGPPLAKLEPHAERDAVATHRSPTPTPTPSPNPTPNASPSPNPNQVATLIETLRVRLLRRQARLDQGGAGEAGAAAPGCALTPARDEIAAEDGKPAPGFEGRTVNGWVI